MRFVLLMFGGIFRSQSTRFAVFHLVKQTAESIFDWNTSSGFI